MHALCGLMLLSLLCVSGVASTLFAWPNTVLNDFHNSPFHIAVLWHLLRPLLLEDHNRGSCLRAPLCLIVYVSIPKLPHARLLSLYLRHGCGCANAHLFTDDRKDHTACMAGWPWFPWKPPTNSEAVHVIKVTCCCWGTKPPLRYDTSRL